LSDQTLDDIGEMLVEPGLQQRSQHIPHNIRERSIGCAEGEFAFPPSLARYRAELGKSSRSSS
jgi:hypothetical protein